MTRKYEDPINSLSSLNLPESEADHSIKHLRNRVHVLQIAHLKAMQELERCEKMLHAQTNINRELALEIEELTTRKVVSTDMLQKQMKDLEATAEERQQRIQILEAQIRQLKYARDKLLRKQQDEPELDTSSDEEDAEIASISESLVMAARDLAPGDQLLEIWIVSGSYDRSVVTSNSSTFVLCDFYDFESQSTSLLVGNRPDYNFSTLCKVTVDGFFLRFLASESIVFEVHQAVRGDFKLVGTATMRLAALLQSKGSIKESALPVKLVPGINDSSMLGSMNIVVRLSTPISEIWRLHLQSYPQDIKLLSRKTAETIQQQEDILSMYDENDSNDMKQRQVNELEITIFACKNLRSYCRKKKANESVLSHIPSSYVHYQLLGFPDVFTNIVPETANPEFDLECSKQIYTLDVDVCLLRFFSKFRLWFTVFDDLVATDDLEKDDGVVGRCGLLLEDLIRGDCIRGWFPLSDQNDQQAGEISVMIQWKDPFRILQVASSQRGLESNKHSFDMHVLDIDQQYALLSMFSPDMDGRVNYRQFLHYAFPPEALELTTAKIKEKVEVAMDTQQIQSVQDIFASNREQSTAGMRLFEDDFVKMTEKYGIFLTENEMQILKSSFMVSPQQIEPNERTIEVHQDCKLGIHYLLLHINPRAGCAVRLLLHKVRHTLRLYMSEQKRQKSTDIKSPSKPFEKYDVNHAGLVTRSEFRSALSSLGFELQDIDKNYKDLVASIASCTGSKEPKVDSNQNQSSVIDLNEDILHDSKATMEKRAKTSATVLDNKLSIPSKQVTSAESEFERRKKAFADRIKAIANSSNKSMVYEQLEKQRQQLRSQAEDMNAEKPLPSSDPLSEQISKLHAPQVIHNDAARMVQKQYRRYRTTQQLSREQQSRLTSSILDVDSRLKKMLKSWTAEELESLEETFFRKIKAEFSDAFKSRALTKKQFIFVAGQIPRIAIEPDLLWKLMAFFSIPTGKQVAKLEQVAFRPLVHFICSVTTQTQDHPICKVIDSIYLDSMQALGTFESVGDMNSTGCISFKRFRHCLQRLGVRLLPKDLRVVMVLFDNNGVGILYHAFLHLISQSPLSIRLRSVLTRCQRFGISQLESKLIMYVSSEDGFMSKQDLHQVLTQDSHNEFVKFEAEDSNVLFEVMQLQKLSDDVPSEKISIKSLITWLQECLKRDKNEQTIEGVNCKYTMSTLQRLARNCRKLLTPSFSDLAHQFERFDWKERNIISLAEFVSVVQSNGFKMLTTTQIKHIAKSFGVKASGEFGINYRQFLEWTTPCIPIEVTTVEDKLRKIAQKQAEQTQSKQLSEVLYKWRECFVEVDTAKSGHVTRSQFVTICSNSLHLALNTEELRVLLYAYDRNMEDEVNYSTFLQLNWNEANTSLHAENLKKKSYVQINISNCIKELKEEIQAKKVSATELANAFRSFDERSSGAADASQFILSFKRVGISLSGHCVQGVFHMFGEGSDKSQLNYVQFMTQTLDLNITSKPKLTRLSSDDERRLSESITSAAKYSFTSFQRAMNDFQEFCVVHRFKSLASNALWKELEKNGFLELLSKRGVGLLIQRFMVIKDIEIDENYKESKVDDAQVSLKAVHAFLNGFASLQFESKKPSSPKKTVDFEKASAQTDALDPLRRLLDACESQGINVRTQFEAHDPKYTGSVTAMELKQVLMGLNIGRFTMNASPEAAIGQLVRRFRSQAATDAVSYVSMLHQATSFNSGLSSESWFLPLSEHLRARIRLKAGFSGKIDAFNPVLCKQVDASFAHFDLAKKGYLTSEDLQQGLSALKYEFTTTQLEFFMTQLKIFRHNGGGLSRMEFDAFVLDPYAFRALKLCSVLLFSSFALDEEALPRIAQLSRAFAEHNGHQSCGVLPLDTAYRCLEQVLQQRLSSLAKQRLQLLFDVNRDGRFANILFMKVISQWNEGGAPSPSPSKESTSKLKPEPKDQSRISFDSLLRSLYAQLSSVDFESQLDIVEEYLMRKDWQNTGTIKLKHLAQIFEQIGLSLTSEAMKTLQHCFRDQETHARDESNELIRYQNLLHAVQELHENTQEHSRK